MDQLKYFTREGNVYTEKKRYGMALFLLIVMGGLTWICIDMNPGNKIYWLFIILGIAAPLGVMLKNFKIDFGTNEITTKPALIRPTAVIPISGIQNFTLHEVSYMGLITTNASLEVHYLKNGKEKSLMVAQGFSKKGMQKLLNELDEILASNGKGAL